MAEISYEKMMSYYEARVGGLTNDVYKRDVAIDSLEEQLEALKAENDRLREVLVKTEEGDAAVRAECDRLAEENRRFRSSFAPESKQNLAAAPLNDGELASSPE